MMRTTLIVCAGLLFTAFAAAPASAQQGVPPQQQQEVPDVDVGDEELTTIAEAYIDVQNLTAEFNEVVQQAGGAEEAQEIQAEYAQRANDLVEDHGLSLERYDLVVRAATVDEELRNRLLQEIERLMDAES